MDAGVLMPRGSSYGGNTYWQDEVDRTKQAWEDAVDDSRLAEMFFNWSRFLFWFIPALVIAIPVLEHVPGRNVMNVVGGLIIFAVVGCVVTGLLAVANDLSDSRKLVRSCKRSYEQALDQSVRNYNPEEGKA
jgi:hypothetical protein